MKLVQLQIFELIIIQILIIGILYKPIQNSKGARTIKRGGGGGMCPECPPGSYAYVKGHKSRMNIACISSEMPMQSMCTGIPTTDPDVLNYSYNKKYCNNITHTTHHACTPIHTHNTTVNTPAVTVTV